VSTPAALSSATWSGYVAAAATWIAGKKSLTRRAASRLAWWSLIARTPTRVRGGGGGAPRSPGRGRRRATRFALLRGSRQRFRRGGRLPRRRCRRGAPVRRMRLVRRGHAEDDAAGCGGFHEGVFGLYGVPFETDQQARPAPVEVATRFVESRRRGEGYGDRHCDPESHCWSSKPRSTPAAATMSPNSLYVAKVRELWSEVRARSRNCDKRTRNCDKRTRNPAALMTTSASAMPATASADDWGVPPRPIERKNPTRSRSLRPSSPSDNSWRAPRGWG